MPEINTRYGRILFRKGDGTVNDIATAVHKAEAVNDRLFGIKPNPYTIKLVYLEQEYDNETGLKGIATHRGGYAIKNKITIISPCIKPPPFDIDSFFFHEINHMYYISLVGSYHPVWFSEGMATYLMGTYDLDVEGWKTYFRAIKHPEKALSYRYMKRRYFQNKEFYPLSYIVYRHLAKKHGNKEIIKLLKAFAREPSKVRFEKLLVKHFSKGLSAIVQEAIAA